METTTNDEIFVFMTNDDNETIFLNLYQVVRADGWTDDQIVLHLSNGHTFNMHGAEAVEKIVGLLAARAMTPDGKPLLEVAAELKAGHKKIKLIKPEAEP